MKLLTIMLLLFIGASEAATHSEIGVIMQSKHFDTKNDYNEQNPGIYVINRGYIVGAYKNSYSAPTEFIGKVISTSFNNHSVKLSLGYGVSYGYGWNSGLNDPAKYGAKLLPFVLPTLSFKRDNFYMNIHIVGNAVAWSISQSF